LTWTEVDALDPFRVVPILPVGAVEAHGPHLPLSTDGIIAEAMATRAGEALMTAGFEPLVLPRMDYSAAPFANGFAGTISIRPETVTQQIVDIGTSLAARGYRILAIANAHLDPAHLGSLHAAAKSLSGDGLLQVAFPDLTRKPWALRLTDEFKSGACHAGRFEGSIVMAARPELVRDEVRQTLEPNPVSIARAIRDGLDSFEEAGGPRAYFGEPALATAEEGQSTIEALGSILEEAILERLQPDVGNETDPAERVESGSGES
jgi:creatinine amidohydrolase